MEDVADSMRVRDHPELGRMGDSHTAHISSCLLPEPQLAAF